MTLSPYHQKYASQPDAEVQKRVNEKRLELAAVFEQVPLKTTSESVRIAVVGCGDKRYVHGHKDIFGNLLKRPVEITTFDIAIDHLEGEHNVFQHDCILPLPNGPFDITYAHVFLRFIETEKQWDVIQNSFHALKPGGLAIHLLDTEDYETEAPLLPNGLFSVPLKRWEEKLDELGIEYREIPVKYGLALVILNKLPRDTKYKGRKYEVSDYSQDWQANFLVEADILKSIMKDDALAIEHIGSTAVEGLAGKPTIDVLVIVENSALVDKHLPEMIAAGYRDLGEYVLPETRLFVREEDNTRLVNVHFFLQGHPHIEEMILVREHLRNHPEEVKQYSELKQRLYQGHPDNYGAYREVKDAYMKELLKRAKSIIGKTYQAR